MLINWYFYFGMFMFQKMSKKFAFDFISLNRPDRTPAVHCSILFIRL